jgi:hypothetical protein
MSTIKPRDLVRTPSGDTGICQDILPYGEREVLLLNGMLLRIKASLLYLVRAAKPRPWQERIVP